jgi:hypothetical protein
MRNECPPIVKMKRCTRCKQMLPADTEHFHADKNARTGFTTACKPYLNAAHRAQQAKRKAARLAAAESNGGRQEEPHKIEQELQCTC